MLDSSFEVFFKSNESKMKRVIWGYVRSIDTSAEIVLEAFTIVHRHWNRVQAMDKPEAYAMRIAVNLAKRHLLERKKKGFLLQDQEEDFIGQVPSNSPDPEQMAMMREAEKFLEKAFEKLKEEERNSILLRDVEGLSFEEVSQALGMKLPTVKSHYRRGKIRLAGEMEAFYGR